MYDQAKTGNERRRRVTVFKDALAGPNRFVVSGRDEGWLVASKTCAFEFLFERRSSSSYVLLVSEPHRPRDGMSLFILRMIVGAAGEGGTDETALAKVVNDHFPLLLQGDFSVRRQYSALEGRVLDGLQKAWRLPADHPIRRKIGGYDPSWLADIEAFGG